MKNIFDWLIKKWQSMLFRIWIYSMSFGLFMFFCERNTFDQFLKFIFMDTIEPVISSVIKDGRLSEWIISNIVGSPVIIYLVKCYVKKILYKKDDSK